MGVEVSPFALCCRRGGCQRGKALTRTASVERLPLASCDMGEFECNLNVECNIKSECCIMSGQNMKENAKVASKFSSGTVLAMSNYFDNVPARSSLCPSQLFMACSSNDVERVDELLRTHADTEWTNSSGITPLIAAATYGHTGCVRLLIDAGCDLDQTDQFGRTAVFAAVRANMLETFQALRDAGALIDKPNRTGRTPLFAAAYGGYDECVQALIDAGANIHHVDNEDETAYETAADRGHTGTMVLLK